MARRRLIFTEAEIRKRYAAGRGEGDGADYMPWLEHHDLSSLGLSTRIYSPKTRRIHHLLSGIEAGAFLEMILNPDVLDVQEQFPLDREDTRSIATEIGVRHPVYPGGTVDVVMTTDLVVHVVADGNVVRFARAVKPAGELDSAGTLLKLQIERLYWARRSVDWMLITDQDQSQQRRNGLEWMHPRYELDGDAARWRPRVAAVIAACRGVSGRTFGDVERTLVRSGEIEAGETIEIVRHLCARGVMRYDPETVFDLRWPVERLPIAADAIPAFAA